jgi:hypothetical protein
VITFPGTTIRVSLSVLLGWIITAVLATPAAVSIITDLEQGKPITSAAIWGAVIGVGGFIANTLIHLNTQSSGPEPTPPAKPAA